MPQHANQHGIEIKARLGALGKTQADLWRGPLCQKAGVSYNQIKGYLNGFHGINGGAFLAIANQLSYWEREKKGEPVSQGGDDASEI